MVTIGRRVDQTKQTLSALGRARIVLAAVLCANVDRWLRRHLTAFEDIREFTRVIRREKDVVAMKFETFSLGAHHPGHRRERTPCASRGSGVRGFFSKQAGRKRCAVGVDNDGIGFDVFSVAERYSAGTSVPRCDLDDFRIKAKVRSMRTCRFEKRLCETVHAAADEPHSLLFHMRDQHQRGRCLER